MKNTLLVIFIGLALSLAACGSAATPVPSSDTLTLEAAEASDETSIDEGSDAEEVAEEPTEVPPTATNTPEPPTATPTEVPPTPEPTEEPEEEVAVADDQIAQLVSLLGDPAQGEVLFNANYNTDAGGWACATCHNHESEERKIGPGLLNIHERGGERVEGEVAERYIWNSIINPQAYIVEGYEEGQQMPGNYRELLSDDELYHLVAYLMTLGNE